MLEKDEKPMKDTLTLEVLCKYKLLHVTGTSFMLQWHNPESAVYWNIFARRIVYYTVSGHMQREGM
jgi:hypothetical protein